MAIEIIRYSRNVVEYDFEHYYENVDRPGSGFSFPANEFGDLLVDQMSKSAMESYEMVCEDDSDFVYVGLQRYTRRWHEPAAGRCYCGAEVLLEYNTNECEKCHALYNMSGQQLSDPRMWGEETGEHPVDVMNGMDNHNERE